VRLAWHRDCSNAEAAALLRAKSDEEDAMLWTITVILLVLWALGLFTAYTAGGLIHLLLVIALIVVVFQFISGRRAV
jgi:fatty acid desaturase